MTTALFPLGVCEHGLSAWLCEGPDHYPADDNWSENLSTSELMGATSRQYHARGENCSWDCGSCPGNSYAEQEEDWAFEQAQAEAAPAYLVQTPYGTVSCLTLEAAKAEARSAAQGRHLPGGEREHQGGHHDLRGSQSHSPSGRSD